MTALTRRRATADRHECWHIYYGGVQVGTIGERAGVPIGTGDWGWSLGFRNTPGDQLAGSEKSFKAARASFDRAWLKYLPTCTEQDFEAWRHDRDWTAWQQQMVAGARLLPTQVSTGQAWCFCGAAITLADMYDHVISSHAGLGM